MEDFNIDTLTEKFKGQATKWKWAIGLATVLFVGPIIWGLVNAAVGLATLGLVTAVLLLGTLFFLNVLLPAATDKMATTRINIAVAQATTDPIPTLKADLQQNIEARNEDDQAITDYDTSIQSIKQDIASLTQDLGPDGVRAFNATVAEMDADLAGMKSDLEQFDADISAQRREIKRLEAFWKVAGAVDKANAKLNARRRGEAIRQIKNDAALASVNDAVARSRAQLRQRVRNRKSTVDLATTPAITNNPSPAAEWSAVVPEHAKSTIQLVERSK